jgi:hypothetical protein
LCYINYTSNKDLSPKSSAAMIRFLVILLTLLRLLPAFAADGCASDETLVTDEFGDLQCRKETVSISCPGGDGNRYLDKVCPYWISCADPVDNGSYSCW